MLLTRGGGNLPRPTFPLENQPRLVWLPNLILENPIGIKGYILRIGSEDLPRTRLTILPDFGDYLCWLAYGFYEV